MNINVFLVLLNNLHILAQTAIEKQRTVLYVGLALIFLWLFVMDIYGKNKFGGDKIVKKIILRMFLIVLVMFVVLWLMFGKN